MIPITKPSLGREEVAAVQKVIESGWVTQGPKVKEFEKNFAAYTGAINACAVSNCTAALHLALLGVGVKPGDVVLTVSHSFIATANAIRHCGAEPLFVDIDPATYNMAPKELALFITQRCQKQGDHLYFKDIDRIRVGESPLCQNRAAANGRVAAILAVHQMGMPCDLRQIISIAQKFNLPVVEDAACAIGSEITFDSGKHWEKVGKPHGDVACFSFHPRKVLTTGDGGMLTTNNPKLAKQFRLWRQHGMSVPDTERHTASKIIFEEYLTTGYNYRMTDIQAAIGIEQLKKINTIVTKRRDCAAFYREHLQNNSHICLPLEPKWARTNWQSYPIRLSHAPPEQQKRIMQLMQDRGMATRRGIMNSHQERPYLPAGWDLPKSEKSRDRVILLPLYETLRKEEQQTVINTLREVLLQ